MTRSAIRSAACHPRLCDLASAPHLSAYMITPPPVYRISRNLRLASAYRTSLVSARPQGMPSFENRFLSSCMTVEEARQSNTNDSRTLSPA